MDGARCEFEFAQHFLGVTYVSSYICCLEVKRAGCRVAASSSSDESECEGSGIEEGGTDP
jgi:hypothetical protein